MSQYKVTEGCDVSHHISEFSAMTEELWQHALAFLDRHGPRAGEHRAELYEFADKTGILERHKQLLARPGHETQVRLSRESVMEHHGEYVSGRYENYVLRAHQDVDSV